MRNRQMSEAGLVLDRRIATCNVQRDPTLPTIVIHNIQRKKTRAHQKTAIASQPLNLNRDASEVANTYSIIFLAHFFTPKHKPNI